jgi:hypothetical protein
MKKIIVGLTVVLLASLAAPPSLVADDYSGTIRVFIVEPVSRWADGNGDAYSFGMLDFALEMEVDIKDYEAWEQTVVFNPGMSGFTVSPNNIMAQAVLFNADSVLKDAFPPYGYIFGAHYSDAAAQVRPGQIRASSNALGFTHTAWVEQSGSGG